ncbi:hypothetical protein B0H13DRAFT_2341412 [Mycena leptocephala]|nr:hypothetical protein B0H13DRAFT_2341412 [Mycena leptocephala]
MFSKLSIVVASVLITLAAAIPTGTPPPPITPPSSPQCCNNLEPSNSTDASAIAGLLGIDLTGLDVLVGLRCSSIAAVDNNWHTVPHLLLYLYLTLDLKVHKTSRGNNGRGCRSTQSHRAARAVSVRSLYFATNVDEDDFDFQHGRSSSLPPTDTSFRPPSPQKSAPPSLISSTDRGSCTGVVVDWNPEPGSADWTFPWHRVIHDGASDSQTG